MYGNSLRRHGYGAAAFLIRPRARRDAPSSGRAGILYAYSRLSLSRTAGVPKTLIADPRRGGVLQSFTELTIFSSETNPNSFNWGGLMTILNDCVVMGDKVYCWDSVSGKCVGAKLEAQPEMPVPDEAVKAIMMKRFNLVERGGEASC
jgi:hypothetical protein